jgi:DNA (cytosine-5)-methyltransferase 1
MPAVAFMENQQAQIWEADTVQALNKGGGKPGQGYPAIRQASAVRRLTPEECEKLQGFPPGYTAVPYRNKPAADGPRYKALGNSMAVPVMRWIGERIAKVEAMTAAQAEAA